MSLFNMLLSGFVGTKIVASTISRYTENGPDGKKVSTTGKIIDDLNTVSTIGITSLCILKLWPVWSKYIKG